MWLKVAKWHHLPSATIFCTVHLEFIFFFFYIWKGLFSFSLTFVFSICIYWLGGCIGCFSYCCNKVIDINDFRKERIIWAHSPSWEGGVSHSSKSLRHLVSLRLQSECRERWMLVLRPRSLLYRIGESNAWNGIDHV